MSARVKKKNQLQLHKDNECDCFDSSVRNIDKRCIYHDFPDGWSFVPDVGNGQKRGEVFTPLWVVNKMIAEVGLIPTEAVYDNIYDVDKADTAISSTVVEPAVGTGNYCSTIIYHKLNYVKALAYEPENNSINIQKYHQKFLEALASVYVFDIDAGNIQATRMRFLKKNDDTIYNDDNVKYWVKYIVDNLDKNVDLPSNINDMVSHQVIDSLQSADSNWSKYINSSEGICKRLYRDHVGKDMDKDFEKVCLKVLDENFKIFNGIVEEDSVSEDFICPGFKNVFWYFWNINVADDLSVRLWVDTVPLLGQIKQGELDELLQKIDDFKSEHCSVVEVESDTVMDLFSSIDDGVGESATEVFDSPQNLRLFNKMIKESEVLKNVIKSLDESCQRVDVLI